jgi:hypothetical protein
MPFFIFFTFWMVGALPLFAQAAPPPEALHLAFVDDSRLVVLYFQSNPDPTVAKSGHQTHLALHTPAGTFGHFEKLMGSGMQEPELPLPQSGSTMVMEVLAEGALLVSAQDLGAWQPEGADKSPRVAGRLPVANAKAMRLWVDEVPQAQGKSPVPLKTRGVLFGRDRAFSGDVLIWWGNARPGQKQLVVLDTDSMWQSAIEDNRVAILPIASKKPKRRGPIPKAGPSDSPRQGQVHSLDAVQACGLQRPASWVITDEAGGGYRFFARERTVCTDQKQIAFARGKRITARGDQAALAIWIQNGGRPPR